MSVSSIGSDASQLFHLLKERRQNQAAAGSTAATTQTAATTTTSTGNAAPLDGIGKSAARLLTDLKSLLIGVQSGSTAATTTPTATTGTAATSTATDAAGTATTDPASTVLDDLTSLFGNLQKAVGGGHHHHHGPPPSDAGTQATTGDTATAAPSATGLLDSFAKALKAYVSQSAGATTAITSTAVSA